MAYPKGSPSPPAYTPEPFISSCPKQSLVEMESAPGTCTPMTSLSQQSTMSGSHMNDSPLPPASRFKSGGILQRQLSRNLYRRARAFSLSDVGSEQTERIRGVSPLALSGNVKTSGNSTILTSKTVTIQSPDSPRKTHQRKTSDTHAYSRSGGHTRHISDVSCPKEKRYAEIPIEEKKPQHTSVGGEKKIDENVQSSYQSRQSTAGPTSIMSILNESELFARKRSVNFEGQDIQPIVSRRRTSCKSSSGEEYSASRKPSIVSVETWVESQIRKSLAASEKSSPTSRRNDFENSQESDEISDRKVDNDNKNEEL